MRKLSIGITGLVVGTAAAQVTFTETFDGPIEGGWTFGAPTEFIDPTGGNPGAFLHADGIDTFAPSPETAAGTDSVFAGDYRARQVTSVGVDLLTIDVDFSAADRPLSVLLVDDNGTPGDFSDDWAAYHIGTTDVPVPGEGWRSFTFDIPSDSPTLPAGWDFVEFGPGATPSWDEVITDVDQLEFYYGDPTGFAIFQMWELGLDNATITYIPEPASLALLLIGAALARRR